MNPYYQDDHVTIYHADCRDLLDDLTFDVIVMDPPYGIDWSTSRPGSHRPRSIVGDNDTSLRDAVLRGRTVPAIVFGSWKAARPEGTRAVLIWDKGEASGMGDLSLPWKPNIEEVYVIGSGFSGHRG